MMPISLFYAHFTGGKLAAYNGRITQRRLIRKANFLINNVMRTVLNWSSQDMGRSRDKINAHNEKTWTIMELDTCGKMMF